jgi:hypothetical protein
MDPVTQRRTLSCALVLFVAALAGCSVAEPSPAASAPSAPATLAATDASSPSPDPSETAAATPWPTAPAECPVTIGKRAPAEIGNALFGASSAAGNDGLWVGGLWSRGVIVAEPVFVNADGSVGMKFGWWRIESGALAITGRRLDGTASAATGDVPDGYGLTGFQASGVTFPTEGCWEITGTVGSVSLTFVTFVIKVPA